MSFSVKGRSLLKSADSIDSKIQNAIAEIAEGRNSNRESIIKEISKLVNIVNNVHSEFKNIVSPIVSEFNKSPNNVYFGRKKTGIFGRVGDLTLIKMPPIMAMDNIISKLKNDINRKKNANLKSAKNKIAANEASRKAAKNAAERKARDNNLKQLKEMSATIKQVKRVIGNNSVPPINSKQLNLIKNSLTNANKVKILKNRGYRNVDFNKVRNGTIDVNSAKNMINTLRKSSGKQD